MCFKYMQITFHNISQLPLPSVVPNTALIGGQRSNKHKTTNRRAYPKIAGQKRILAKLLEKPRVLAADIRQHQRFRNNVTKDEIK